MGCVDRRNALLTAKSMLATTDMDAFAGRCLLSCPTRGGDVFDHLVGLLRACSDRASAPQVPLLREKVTAGCWPTAVLGCTAPRRLHDTSRRPSVRNPLSRSSWPCMGPGAMSTGSPTFRTVTDTATATRTAIWWSGLLGFDWDERCSLAGSVVSSMSWWRFVQEYTHERRCCRFFLRSRNQQTRN